MPCEYYNVLKMALDKLELSFYYNMSMYYFSICSKTPCLKFDSEEVTSPEFSIFSEYISILRFI